MILNVVPQSTESHSLTDVTAPSYAVMCNFSPQKSEGVVLHLGHTQSSTLLKIHFKLVFTYLDQHWYRNTCSWGFLSHL